MSDFLNAWRVQNRVIHAFILRETRTRFGRSRLGYFWALFEPLAYILSLIGIYSLLGRGAPIDVDIKMFFFTGIIPWLLFSRGISAVGTAIEASQPLLTYPHVKAMDVVISRIILEFSTLLIVACIYIGILYYLGIQERIESVLSVLFALFVAIFLGASLGLVGAVIRLYLPAYSNFQSVLTRILFLSSGIFFVADTLPAVIRDGMWFNPLLHIIEWSRSAYFYGFQSHFYDWRYPFVCTLILLFIGLAAERVSRYKLRQI